MSFSSDHHQDPRLFIGIDLGTSGVRVCGIDVFGQVKTSRALRLSPPNVRGVNVEQSPLIWWKVVEQLLKHITQELTAANIAAIAIDGTSGSMLLADRSGNPLGSALMYNDARATVEAELIAQRAPKKCGAQGPTSGLAKLLWLKKQCTLRSYRILSQADWIMGRLLGQYGFSDENNCLKLGYDSIHRRWPDWMKSLELDLNWLPEVYPAGQVVGAIDPGMAHHLGLPPHTNIVTGTTDSVAGLLASGARRPGDAVTSLGSTLVLKIISTKPLFSPEYGIYSHRLGDWWLVGGASNSGGAVLRQFYSEQTLGNMTPRLQPERPTGLDYYPLTTPGERFPIADPALQPRLSPRPSDPLRFFQGLLEGIANIERLGYEKLQAFGAPYPSSIRTVGGGAKNKPWTTIRQQRLAVGCITASHTEAAYGTALLARDAVTTPRLDER